VWYRNGYLPTWRQAVAIEDSSILPILITATGEAVLGPNVLIHRDQNKETKLLFLAREYTPEPFLVADQRCYQGRDQNALPPKSVKLTEGLRFPRGKLLMKDGLSQPEDAAIQRPHPKLTVTDGCLPKINHAKAYRSKAGRCIRKPRISL